MDTYTNYTAFTGGFEPIPDADRRIGLAVERIQAPNCDGQTDDENVTYLLVVVIGFTGDLVFTPLTP